jgi:dihydrofolate synthase/folylpolyglutamate synthase
MTYDTAIDFLYGLHKFGMKMGLENIKALCAYLDYPETRFPSVHIAGTNGKGSVSTLLASMAMESGLKTALYTSPHIKHFTERMKINGVPISNDKVQHYTEWLEPEVRRLNATFFEATTAMAFKYFADEKAQLAVVETGLGGRLDSTNILKPKFSVITNIGLDHTEILGNTIGEIAMEKAGIIKHGKRVFTAETKTEALSVFESVSIQNLAHLIRLSEAASSRITSQTLGALEVEVATEDQLYKLASPLWASYQEKNIALAVVCGEELHLSKAAIEAGVKKVQRNFGIGGRLEIRSRVPYIIYDVSHNAAGLRETVRTLSKFRDKFQNVFVVFGVMKDKNFDAMLDVLKPFATTVIAVQPNVERALAASDIKRLCEAKGIAAINAGSVQHGVEQARLEMTSKDLMLVIGSFFTVAEVY